MDDEGDTNQSYYAHLWTKPIKDRTKPKPARLREPRRESLLGEPVILRDLAIGFEKYLRSLHHKGVNPSKCPLLRR